MGSLFLTKQDLEKYQRIMNKYAPYPTTLEFLDDYKTTNFSFVDNNQAKVVISTFVSEPYSFHDNENGRELFHDGIVFHELAHLCYTDFAAIITYHMQEKLLLEKLQEKHDAYWQDESMKPSYQKAFIEHYYFLKELQIFNSLEDGAIEHSFYLQFPIFSNRIIYARKKLVEYEILENIYTKQKGLPVLLEAIHHYCTCFYKQKQAPNELEGHPSHQEIKSKIIEARLYTKNTKQRISLAKEIALLIKEEIETEATIFFEKNYNHRYGEMEKLTGKNNESLPGNRPEEMKNKKEIDPTKIKEVEEMQETKQQEEYIDLEEEYTDTSKMQNIVRVTVSEERLSRELPIFTLNRKEELLVEAKQNAYLVQKRIVHKKRTYFKKKLDYGSRLDTKQLYRGKIDGKIYQISKKSKQTNVVVSILIDSSFSMQGKRQKEAIETAYKLGVMFQDLRIPFCINGHSVGDDDITDFVQYVAYDQCRQSGILNELFYLNTKGFTHEYIALKHSLENLSKHKRGTQKGLVIVISDAETESKLEIQTLCQRYKRLENIDVLAIAVGKLGEVAQTYENYLYLPTTKHFFLELVKEFERLSI
ncbi:vWA domain-containing protein [Tannockella kyphosi]|uniref:vWA domain-containing protein n=1 Tax=Tannockella kyphosi TaxID=2899121 RepID=UPI002013180C|nr:vWA domain-containing protein [Tannockella kyphosi]